MSILPALEIASSPAPAAVVPTPAAIRRRVLIVSPHFVPASTPDMQRVRASLPYFRECGWDPYVLAVEPSSEEPLDELMAETVPADVPIERVTPLPLGLTRRFGVGNIALRAWMALLRAGSRTIVERHIDLVYFSTTMFMAMPLGRIWKTCHGVPFVLDIQDPWLTDYYETHPDAARPAKYGLSHRLHAVLEPWTMSRASGVIAVSQSYVDTLTRRYPGLDHGSCATIPFAASEEDFALLDRRPQPNHVFEPGRGVNAVYVGRGGADMAPALRILFEAVQTVRREQPALTAALRMFFVGTDYASGERARKTVEPLAASAGVADIVSEQANRVPYFEALQLLKDASLLLLIGSDDPQYSASKAYPYLLARKPLVAIVHERSPLVPLLQDSATLLVTFGEGTSDAAAPRLARQLRDLLTDLPNTVTLSERAALACSAREMTRRQCELFDRVLTARTAA
jgi:hypothetical protein